MSKTIAITGATGFVGGETLLDFKDNGYQVIAIDNRPPPEHLQGIADQQVVASYDSEDTFKAIEAAQVDAIVHCGATSLVGPSVKNPSFYYENNVIGTKRLMDFVVDRLPDTRFIFSSSSSVYGEPVMVPISEVDPPQPLSPYGESKLMTDMMLSSYHTAYNFDYVSFRYFNAVGADPQVRHGQEPRATHIIARVLEGIRDGSEFTLFGTTYPTPDGSCVRDHVHVADLARAHRMALDSSFEGGVYNAGIGHGVSNLEVIKMAEEVTGQKLNYRVGEPRPGDPSQLTAVNDRLTSQGWNPEYTLHDMITHAWNWYMKSHNQLAA